nr:hypothetical protein [Tanacetum cinerariifolium]
MGMDTVQLETAVNTISHEYLLEFTSEYGISKTLHPELLGPEDRIVDFPEGKVGVYTRRACIPNCRGLTNKCSQRRDVGGWHLLRRSCEGAGYAPYTHPKTTGDVTVREMDLFNLIRASNPTKMDEPAVATDSSGVPSTIERSSLDFAHEAGASDRGTAAPEMPPLEDVPATAALGAGQAEETAATEPPVARESRKRGHDRVDANAPQSHCEWIMLTFDPQVAPIGGKSLAAIQLGLASKVIVPEGAHADVSDPDPLSFADAPSRHPVDVQSFQGIAAAGDPKSENASSPAEVGSPGNVYRPKWGVTNGSLLDTPEACQDLVDHAASPGYFSELRYMHNEEFLGQYNINLAQQVAMGSQLRLRFEQEAKLLRKSVAQVARWDQRIQARELEIKNLEARLETEAEMKKAAKYKSVGLIKELEDLRARFLDLQEFKRYEDERVEQRCAELDARLDALSIDFDKELYPHMLTAIAGRMWVIGYGLRLAMMKCAESLEMRQAFADVVSAGAQLKVESIEAYDPKVEAKFVAALQSLKDLNSSQLTIPVYPEVRDPRNHWVYKEEMKFSDAIAANISRAEKKKKCCIVCRTHGVGSAHHSMSDGIPVSVPTVVPQGLALLLVDATTQTNLEDT